MKGCLSVCSCNDDTSGVGLNVIFNIAFYVADILKRTGTLPGTSLVLHAFVNFTVQQQETLENTLSGLHCHTKLGCLGDLLGNEPERLPARDFCLQC